MRNLFIISSLCLLFSCQAPTGNEQAALERVDQKALKTAMNKAEEATGQAASDDYWFQGKAELNHYEVKQNRYRDVHEGEAIVVFVSEDFLVDKQVKNDYYRNPNSTSIIKTNKLLRFPTGIYDYSLMTSVFTPFDQQKFDKSLKVTHTAQDWCGQGFLQFNKQDEGYKINSFSYFESEGDVQKQLGNVMLEDELFNLIRLNPANVPLGKQEMVPSADVLRMLHLPLAPRQAKLSMEDYEREAFEGNKLRVLKVSYPEINRTYNIFFEGVAPYQIVGWEDEYPSAFDKRPRKTTAKRTHKRLSAYWGENALSDQKLRKEFGLKSFLK
ncbi:MAG: hypothetical protein AAFY71_06315 [Bacteroidota bacterium]